MAGRVFPPFMLLGLLSVLLHGASAIECTERRTRGNNEYCFVNTTANFTTARGACNEVEAHLARFPDYATAKLVTDGFTTEDVWLDINDIVVEGHFRYSDGSDPDWLKWRDGEPTNGTGEHCVRFTIEPSSERSMTDRPCGVSYRYICEQELPTISTTDQSSTAESTTAATVPDTTPPLSVTTYGGSTSAALTEAGTHESANGNNGDIGLYVGVSIAAVVLITVIAVTVVCRTKRQSQLSRTQGEHADVGTGEYLDMGNGSRSDGRSITNPDAQYYNVVAPATSGNSVTISAKDSDYEDITTDQDLDDVRENATWEPSATSDNIPPDTGDYGNAPSRGDYESPGQVEIVRPSEYTALAL